MDAGRAEGVAQAALAVARELAPEAEALASVVSGRVANTRFARNEVTSSGDVDECEARIALALGRRHAAVATNQVDTASLREAVLVGLPVMAFCAVRLRRPAAEAR